MWQWLKRLVGSTEVPPQQRTRSDDIGKATEARTEDESRRRLEAWLQRHPDIREKLDSGQWALSKRLACRMNGGGCWTSYHIVRHSVSRKHIKRVDIARNHAAALSRAYDLVAEALPAEQETLANKYRARAYGLRRRSGHAPIGLDGDCIEAALDEIDAVLNDLHPNDTARTALQRDRNVLLRALEITRVDDLLDDGTI